MGSLLGENEALRPLLKRARRLNALQDTYVRALAEVLAEDLPLRETFARASRISALMGSTLVIGTASAALATRLKMLSPSLLLEIQKQEQEVTEIRVDLQPAWEAPESKPLTRLPAPMPVPDSVLQQLSDSLGDSPLKDTVERIRRRRARAKPAVKGAR